MPSKVTVAIPFFNALGTLDDAIRSVYAQTFRDWELILLDDGSDDGSLELARRVRDERVRVVSDGHRRGLPTRLNEIADAALAPILARMDADDVMHPDRLALQVAALEARPDVDMVASYAYSFQGSDFVRGVRRSQRHDALSLLRQNGLIHPTLTGRTCWWRANRYDPRAVRVEDKDLWARTWDSLRVHILPQPLLFYREYAAGEFKRFRAALRGEIGLLRRHGVRLVGRRQTLALAARLACKTAAHGIAHGLNLSEVISSRRARALTEAEMRDARAALDTVRAQRVPGLANAAMPDDLYGVPAEAVAAEHL